MNAIKAIGNFLYGTLLLPFEIIFVILFFSAFTHENTDNGATVITPTRQGKNKPTATPKGQDKPYNETRETALAALKTLGFNTNTPSRGVVTISMATLRVPPDP